MTRVERLIDGHVAEHLSIEAETYPARSKTKMQRLSSCYCRRDLVAGRSDQLRSACRVTASAPRRWLALLNLGTTEANVVEPEAGLDVVAVRRPRDPRGEVPAAATQHPGVAFDWAPGIDRAGF